MEAISDSVVDATCGAWAVPIGRPFACPGIPPCALPLGIRLTKAERRQGDLKAATVQKHYTCNTCGAEQHARYQPWCPVNIAHGVMVLARMAIPLVSDEVPQHLRGLHGLMSERSAVEPNA